MSATRVVVTGLGTTSPVGGDVPTTWAALLAGQSGVRPLKHDWAEQLSTQIAAEVAVDPTDVLERVKARRLDRSGQLALVAALEAWGRGAAGDGGRTAAPNQQRRPKGEGPARVLPAGNPEVGPNPPPRKHGS